MIKAIILLLLLIISTAFSVAYHAPISWVLKQADLPKALTIKNTQGKLWHGQAETIKWNNWQIDNANWDIELLPLLTKNLQGEVSGQLFEGDFKALIDANKQLFSATNGTYSNDVTAILKHFNLALVSLTGTVDFTLKRLTGNVKTKQIEQLILKTVWQQAGVTNPLTLKLGQITAKSKMVDKKIVTEIVGLSGDIDISGTVTISPNQNFSTKLKLQPNIVLPNEIKLALRLIGKELPNGDFLINKKGNLKYLF